MDTNDTEPVEDIETPDSPKRDSKARTASAAVFFNENKSIAGFGNSMRAVFTSVRELVENSLDASEKRAVTPEIKINLRRLEKSELVALMGTNVVKDKDKRVEFIELSCRDNGVGVPRDLIPQLFGTVLAGTKYGAQQTRGRFGLGSKMVLLYAMSTLDLPIQITTRPEGENVTYRVQLFINLEKNAPILHKDEQFGPDDEEYFNDYGTEIKVSFTGSWNLAKLYVREYFRQLAIITPYADMIVDLPSDEDEDGYNFYQRVVDDLPKPPEVVRIHPWGTDISTFRREMEHATESNLIDFLVNNFMGVDEAAAEAFFQEVGVETDKRPQELTSPEIRRIVHDGFNRALKESKVINRKRDRVFKFNEPKGDALSPLGAERLRKGLQKELNPEFVESITRSPKAYEGHPFIIEAAIGYGGGVNSAAQSKGVTIVDNRVIYRFANRIPLIFGAGSDLITQIVNSINWSNYGLTRGTEPLAIAVSLVSTKIPFPETSKEYIDKVEEIGSEVRLTLLQLAKKLKTFLGRRRRRQRERRRKSRFERYAPRTVFNLLEILRKEELWDPSTGVNADRIISALSSGNPRIDSQYLPLGTQVFQAPMWATTKTQEKLQNEGIFEIASFLRHSNKDLAKILKKKTGDIDIIKRRTIAELDKAGQIPGLEIDVVLNPDHEVRFHRRDEKEKLIELPRLSKACNRRWIRNAYDYMVSTADQLKKVQGLAIKLAEAERVKIIENMFVEVDDVDLADELSSLLGEGGLLGDFEGEIDKFTQDELPAEVVEETSGHQTEVAQDTGNGEPTISINQLLPPMEEFYHHEKLKVRKVSTILEFLLETTHPSSPIDEKVLATILISTFVDHLRLLVAQNADYGKIKVSVPGQPWIDGYLRNAFKRRNINTVNDIIGFEVPKLAEIGELQRTLFNGILETLIPKNGQISPDDLRIENAEMKLLLLEQAEITSLEKLAATPSIDFAENPVLAPYVDMLIEESKDRIVEFLTMNNMIGPLNLLKELTPELEQELYELQISDSMELLVTPLNEFSKKHQGVIKQAKLSQGTGFTGFYKKQQKLMETIGVTVLEELVYRPNTFLNGELTETQSDEIKALIELLHEPSILFSSNVINSLDLLQNSGVNTLGKFLIWPAERLAQIIDMPDEWINIMRDSFEIKDVKASREQYHPSLTSVSNILTSQEISSIQGLGIDSVIEATSIMWGEDYPEIDGKWDSIRSISSLLTTDLSRILPDVATKKKARSNLTSAISDLEKEGIYTLLQFLRTPPTSLVQKMNSKAKRDIVSTISQEFRSHSPDVISPDSVYHKAAFTYLSIEKLRSPIASLSGFNIRDIGLLSDNGIKSIHQIITLPNSEIAQMLGTTAKIVEQKISDSSFNPTGTPLSIADKKGNLSSVIEFVREGNNYFQRDEINELINSGYNTIEALYYMSDHRTFDVRGVSWEIIHHFKKLMESPPVLITWRKIVKERREIKVDSEDNEALLFSDQITEEETPKEKQYEEVEVEHYETFSSQELEILTRSNISRVMDFLTTPGETISDLLAWDSKLTSQRQSSVILQEAGIELSDLEIFRDDHIELLKDLGIITIEDLYFTTREETWESPSIPFTVIQTVKNILHLPLEHVKTELGEDIYDLLIENDVLTILEFILTGDPILEQKTGLPAERFENLKYALDFGALIESFDKTIMFTPNLAFNDCKLLRNSGIERILDLVLADPKDIAKTLSVQKKEVDLIIKGVNRENIIQTEEDRGVLLSSLNAFSRSDIRSISRSGMFEMNPMDTVQEILYQVNDDNFHGEQYLLEYVKNLQIVCDLKLSQIGDLNDTDVELLKKVGVITISDAILVTYEDLGEVSHDLDVVLTAVTKSVMDMQSFIAMGKLPAQSAMSSGEDEDSLLNVWLNEPEKLDTRTMNNVRSILSLPIRLTSFAKQFPTISEDKLDLSLSEAILLYVPDEEDELHQIQSALETPGILINLLQEGSTPLTLLELSAVEFRALLNNGINTVERIMMNDPKTLSAISGTTQKYWREIKELFDPEMFKARLGDIGLPASIIDLSKEELAVLEEFNIEYLDQVTIYDEPEGIIESLQKFLYGSLSYLSGTPGEKEMAMNSGAISILEASISLKRQGADASVIYDMVSLGWQAFNKYTLPSPSKSKKNDVQTLQELCLQYQINPDMLTKNQVASAELFMKSPLLLPLPRTDLEDIVIEKRCTSILDALTNPLVGGPINTLRETLIEGGSIDILEDAELQPTVIEKISKTIWNRVKETSLSLQDIVSSPRTIESISGIKQRYLGEARDVLRVPLSQLIISDQAIQDHLSSSMYNRLIDLVFDLPALKLSGDSTFTTLVSFLTEGNFSVANDYDLDEELQLAIQTVFGMSISGFHDFWAMTLEESDLLSKIETPPAVKVKDLVNVASSPIYNLKGVTPSEIWEMYLLEIYTISDLIISNKIELSSSTVFTKKRVSELKDIAMKSLRVTSGEPSITIMDLCDAFGHTTKRDIGLDISLLKHKSPHPLIAKELKNVPKKLRDLLTLPVLHTRFGQSLKTEEMDLLCKIGIYSVLDWLVYPEKLTTLPKKFKMQRARLEGIQDKLDELSILTVSDLQLPSIVKEKYQGSTSILQVIFEALHRNERTVLKSLTIPLSYSDLDEQFLQDLSNARINSAFELLHFAPEILGLKLAMPEPKIRKLLLNVDFGSMVQDLENAPLQIKDTESLSKGGIDILINAEIFTALDLYAPLPDGLNRIDQGYLEGLLHILNADISYLTPLGIFGSDFTSLSKRYSNVRDLITDYQGLSKEQKVEISALTIPGLVKLQQSHRQFHDIEGLIIRDEKLLLSGGILTFYQLASSTTEVLVTIGLKEDKAVEIIQLLNSHWRNIIDMPKEVEKIARKQKMQTVADVMQSLDILQIPMSTPIKINQERKLSDLLGELPESIAALEIESVSELMQDKKAIGLLNAQDKDALQIFSLLNRSVRSIPSINQKWLPKLEENGVLRIWQYITEDPVTLADYCGTSVKAQEDYKEKLSLNKIAGSEVKFPTQFKKDIDLFSKYGVYTLQELVSEGFMAGYVESNEEFSTKLSSYKAGLIVPIHHTIHFWTLDPTSREDLAKMGVTLSELGEANSELTQGVLLDALKENLRDGQALDEWLDPKELKSLAKQGVSTVEDWIFRNIRGEIDPTSASFKKFRSTLDLVPDLPIKQIVNGYQNGITHISDILLEDEKELAKKLKTTANKIVTFLDTMKEGNYFSPQLPNLGLVSTSIVEAMREGGITSWAQILGNARKEEIELVKGITWNTVLSVREYANVPLWHSTEIRTLGVKTLRKLVADGVTTIADVLVLGDKFRDFLKDEKLYTTILDNLSRANLRKGAAMISIRLSESYKIRVKDIEAYEKAGILSPMDILIQNYDVAKNSPLIDGIDDWLRIGDYDLEEINFPMKVITKLKSVGIKKVQDAILAPDKLLRDAGATNHQIKAFRKDLNRLKKGDKRVV